MTAIRMDVAAMQIACKKVGFTYTYTPLFKMTPSAKIFDDQGLSTSVV